MRIIFFTAREEKNRVFGLSTFSQPGDARSRIRKKNNGVARSTKVRLFTTSRNGVDGEVELKKTAIFVLIRAEIGLYDNEPKKALVPTPTKGGYEHLTWVSLLFPRKARREAA